MARQRAVARRRTSFAATFEAISANMTSVIRGKDDVVALVLVCLAAEGHLLIEDVPGVGKTSMAKALAASIDCEWRRIQFTPDLLPSDVTGVSVYDRASGTFEFRPGGVFASIVVADEINRASPRTQAALLEAMEERQVTVDSETRPLPNPFMVMATQNPVEHQGTYPLPDSQLDRFLMRIEVGYPDAAAEAAILEANPVDEIIHGLSPAASADDVAHMVASARAVHVSASVRSYIIELAAATRVHPSIDLGMSPRASVALQRASRALAAADGRDFVMPDDVKRLMHPVLQHRLSLNGDAEIAGIDAGGVLDEVIASVRVPTRRAATG